MKENTMHSRIHLWRIERRDGVIMRFGGHDRDITLADGVYLASQPIDTSQYSEAIGFEGGDGEYFGGINHDAVTVAMLENRVFDGAKLFQIIYDWQSKKVINEAFMGYVEGVSFDQTGYQLSISKFDPRLNRAHGRSFIPDCQARLGDHDCRIDLIKRGYFYDGVVEEGSRRFIAFKDCNAASGVFTEGVAEFEGHSARLAVAVDSAFAGLRRVEFARSAPFQIEIGMKFRLFWGCKRNAAQCAARFDNIINFRGFPHLPHDLQIRSDG